MNDPRSTRSLVVRLIGVGLLLPLLAAAVLVWSTQDRQENLTKVPVAIVNNDKIITSPQPMAAGRALSASLTNPKDSDPALDWHLTTSDDAKDGLRTGDFYAVLTIPEDFSSAILSTGTDKPESGQLSLVSNAAASTTVPYISHQVVAAAATALGNQSTQGYLKNVYAGFNKIASSNQQAASSADQLAQGTSELSTGAAQLSDGAASLAGSLGELSAGAEELAGATGSLASGADQVAGGASALAAGAGRAAAGERTLARSARQLTAGTGSLRQGSAAVARGADRLATSTAQLARGNRLLALELQRTAQRCRSSRLPPLVCRPFERLARQSDALARGAAGVDRGADGLAESTASVARGAAKVDRGASQLSGGAADLARAGATLSDSADQLASGARGVAGGATELETSAEQLAGGATQAAGAGESLASGSASLSASTEQTADGAQQLSSGLEKGAKESPTYSSSLQDALAATVSEPVALKASTQHPGPPNAWLIAGIVGVILWLGALATTSSRDPLALLEHVEGPVSSRRLALVEMAPVVGMALLQAVVVLTMLRVFDVRPAAPVWFTILCLLAAVVFALVIQAVRIGLPRAGVAVAVLLLLVQLASLANVVPLETAPGLVQQLNRYLPLPAFTDAASQLIGGGGIYPAGTALVVLVVWGVLGHLVASTVVKRRRVQRPVALGLTPA